MDFLDGLQSSQGYIVIMVVVDRLSKYAHFLALKHSYTTLSVAKIFMAQIVPLQGIPTSIVSDRDKVFISLFWKALFQLQGTKLCMRSNYHPQTDGQTEVANQILEQYLYCFTSEQPAKWLYWLTWAEYSYNTDTSTKISPFEAVYGIPTQTLLSYVPSTTKIHDVDETLRGP